MKYIIANWKAHKNLEEVNDWCTIFKEKLISDKQVQSRLQDDNIAIILCPPYPFILTVKQQFQQFKNIYMGAQYVSSFDEGAYTGEVTAKMLTGIVDYALAGHSERRQHNNETNEHIHKQSALLKTYKINPVVCVRTVEDTIPKDVQFIAYEPVAAIGTGKNENPETVVEMRSLFNIQPSQKFIYGGSVAPDNCLSYLRHQQIDGILPGTSSLDPAVFYNIVSQI